MDKIALSFDIEDWYHNLFITDSSFSKYYDTDEFFKKWKGRYDYITESTIRLLKILKSFNINATFFVVADIIENYPEIVKELKESNNEIACHSLHHNCAIDSKKKLYSIEKWENDLIHAKKILENDFEREVIGYRAPGAYFTTWMIDILERNGFKYDSSIAYNSFYNKTNVILNDIPSFPYYLNKNDLSNRNPNSKLMELPWSYCKISEKIILPAGGAYFFRLLGYSYFKYTLKQCLKNGDAMFYIHPIDITYDKIPMRNFKARPFYWINKGKTTEKRFIKLLKAFKNQFATCREVYFNYQNK